MNQENTSKLQDHISALEEQLPAIGSADKEKILAFINRLEAAAESAGETELDGLTDIFLLLHQNIQDQLSDNIKITDQQLGILTSGLKAIREYLQEPNNPVVIDELLSTVKNSVWQFPLSEIDSALLENMLSSNIPGEITPDLETKPSAEGFSGDVISILKQINQFLFDEEEPDIQLINISETLEQLSEELDQGEQSKYQDIVLYMNKNFTRLKSGKGEFGDTQKLLLTSWVNLLSRLLEHPDDDMAAVAIINNLHNSQWLAPISDSEQQAVADMLGVSLSEENDEGVETEIGSPAKFREAAVIPETESPSAESDNVQVLPAATTLSTNERLLQDIENACSESDPDLTAIADWVEQLGNAAGENDLVGFQDICLILQENLLDAVNDKRVLSSQQKEKLAQWPDLARNYLNHSENREHANTLIRFLQDTAWINPLQNDNATLLAEMFGIQSQDTANKHISETADKPSIQEGIADISAQPHSVSHELIEMLIAEMHSIRENFQDVADKLSSAETEEDIKRDLLAQCIIKLDRFGSACQAAELAGLYQASSVLIENLKLQSFHNSFTEEQANLLSSWPGIVSSYLNNLGQGNAANDIIEILTSGYWPKPLITDVVPALSDLLSAPYPVEQDESREQRQTTAIAEDVSIVIPEDINQELLDGLLQELPTQTESFSAAIQTLVDGSGTTSDMEKAQRVAHTVKGAANTVGIKGIANLTHQVEDILLLLNKHNRLPSRRLSSTLMNAADCLEEMSEALLERGTSPDNAQQVLQEVLDWINRLEKEGVDILETDLNLTTTASTPQTKTDEAIKAGEKEETAIQTLRVPADLIDDMIRILGETIIVTTQLQENVQRSNNESISQFNHFSLMQGLISELDRQVELRGVATRQQQKVVNQSETVNEIFDPLELEQYNELHTITNRLTEAAVDSFEINRNIDNDLHELDELLFDQARLHREIQELVMKTRMVPISSITPRLQRSVRQTCRTTGKAANLYLYGSDTLVDSDVLSNLLDPLMHMLRNAIDHGIEDRETRIRLGKEPEGKIELTFSREGTQIIVKCQDDGAGLNREAIRLKAVEKGIIDPSEVLTDDDLYRMILLPGFSTSKQTTQVSGRGIGMDVVHSHIQAMKGSINISSVPDNGCLFELRLPVTLISSHSLLVRQRDQVLAVSNRGVVQILHPSDSQIINDDEEMRVLVGGNEYDAVNLEDLINMPGDRRERPRETRPALLIQEENINKIVFLQEIMDVRELVIKPMGAYMRGIKGIPGATILGDGSVVPVLDIPELLRDSGKQISKQILTMTASKLPKSLPTALVVDDSLSARRALAQVIKDAGYDVRTAKDGLEAVEIINKKKPDILLVDLEMPRMNGIELSTHVRTHDELSSIPIIMVTSRSTEKHKEQARSAGVNIYLTKPFSDDILLDHVRKLLDN
ncbi:MAG TPA: response regulator [Gammaproteobacteria bacterium]